MILLCFSQVFAIPPRPEAIEFQPLEYMPPRAADFRRMLSDGTIVYVAESHEFPLVNVSITFKGGGSLEPAATPGLASVMTRMVREGGAGDMSPAMFDETLDFAIQKRQFLILQAYQKAKHVACKDGKEWAIHKGE